MRPSLWEGGLWGPLASRASMVPWPRELPAPRHHGGRDGPALTWASPQALAWHLIHEQIPLSVDLQAGLDCCCLALQLPGLRRLLASPEMVTRACSLIHCVRLILEASECRSTGCPWARYRSSAPQSHRHWFVRLR